MPRRKEFKVKARELKCHNLLVEELLLYNSILADYDMDSIEIKILYKKAPAQIRDVDRAIDNLQHYYAANRDKIVVVDGKQVITKRDLAKMMKISRPTLDSWIKNGFVIPARIKGLPWEIFQIDEVIDRLRNYSNKK